MGSSASKPPLRTVIPDDESETAASEKPEDDITDGVDTLGVNAEEDGYPNPSEDFVRESPQVTPNVSKFLSTDGESQHSSNVPPLSFKGALPYHPVPVGTCLQKHLHQDTSSKRADSPFRLNNNVPAPDRSLTPILEKSEDMVDDDDENSDQLTEAPSDKSLMSWSTLNTNHPQSQRENLLLAREKREYEKAVSVAQSSGLNLKGQVTRPLPPEKGNKDSSAKPQRPQTVNTIQTVEEKVEQQKDHRAETFAAVANDLTSDLQKDKLKVKAILLWISKQQIGRLQFGPTPLPSDSPNGYMQLMQEGRGNFPVFFALLCRAASIQCAVVKGISKGAHYEVGDYDTESLQNTWNAVYVDGHWRLVHPLWVCQALQRRKREGWVTLESKRASQSARPKTDDSSTEVTSYNEYFIFTKPEEFIYRNFPDEKKWQLLADPISREDFLRKAYLRPSFFMSEFVLLSEDLCVLESYKGEPCTIVIGYPNHDPDDVVFGYELSYKVKKPTARTASGDSTQNKDGRFVFMTKQDDRVNLEVRFSRTGTYNLRVCGGLYAKVKEQPPWIMDVKLVCNTIEVKQEPLPFDPGIVGWGPGPIASALGLFLPSHTNSVVYADRKDHETTLIQFVLTRMLEVSIELLHHTESSEKLGKFVEYNIVQREEAMELHIEVNFPSFPESYEFGLKLDVKDTDGDLKNACNYLVHKRPKRGLEPFHPRNARIKLNNVFKVGTMEDLDKAINNCIEKGIAEDDPDVIIGRRKLDYLQCRRELKEALLVNRIYDAEHALYRVRASKLQLLLGPDVKRLENHLRYIYKLDKGGWSFRIPEINRTTLIELSRLQSPSKEVQSIVIALYLLLGVNEDDLKNVKNVTFGLHFRKLSTEQKVWFQVRKLLRDQDSTLIEMARLERYLNSSDEQLANIDGNVLSRVQGVLDRFSLDDVRRKDNTAAAYYLWVKSMLTKIKATNRIKSTEPAQPHPPKVKPEADKSTKTLPTSTTNVKEPEMTTPKPKNSAVRATTADSKVSQSKQTFPEKASAKLGRVESDLQRSARPRTAMRGPSRNTELKNKSGLGSDFLKQNTGISGKNMGGKLSPIAKESELPPTANGEHGKMTEPMKQAPEMIRDNGRTASQLSHFSTPRSGRSGSSRTLMK